MKRVEGEVSVHVATEPQSSGVPKRVHIIGGPGSGKSTLGRLIAERLDAPAFDLDLLAAAGPAPEFRMERSLSQRLANIEQVVALPAWVTEGAFLWWTESLLRAADIIVWLDVPSHVAIQRVLARHIREYLGDIAQQVSIREKLRVARYPHLRHLAVFVPYTRQYYHRPACDESGGERDLDSGWALTRADTASWLEGFGSKVVRCSRTSDVERLLAQFTVSESV